MKHILTVALMLNFGAAAIHAQQQPLKMTLSGSGVPTKIDFGANTITDEVTLAGNSTLGPFTLRELRTDESIPQSVGRCGDGSGPIIRVVAGAGVFRFQDGSLLTVTITGGSLCVDLDHRMGHLQQTYTITGGEGRFEGAKGSFGLTATLKAVLFDPSGAAVLLTLTGEADGMIVGVRGEGNNEPR